jgi:hypothetical protein
MFQLVLMVAMVIIPRKDIENGSWEHDSCAGTLVLSSSSVTVWSQTNRCNWESHLLLVGDRGVDGTLVRGNGHRFIGVGYIPRSEDEVVRVESCIVPKMK